MNQIRILHCNNDNKNMGGAYLVTRKMEPHMRELGYVFDYITMDEFVVNESDRINPLPGSKTYSARLRGNKLLGHIKLPLYVEKVLDSNPYKIVHVDIDSAWKALLYAIPAKRKGSKVIIHSHATGIDGDYKGVKKFFHSISKSILFCFTDKYIGCSNAAIQWLCPCKKTSKAELLVNGIDENEFYYDPLIRKACREELNLKTQFILCNVGRINANKNQVFLIDILKELKNLIPSTLLLLVGPSEEADLNKLREIAKTEEMQESVIFVGPTNDVNKYLNAADYFVLPSHFEGFSLASIEAQRTGLKCLLSNGTPPEALISSLAEKEDLKKGPKEWAKLIYNRVTNDHQERKTINLKPEYTTGGMARQLAHIYSTLQKIEKD